MAYFSVSVVGQLAGYLFLTGCVLVATMSAVYHSLILELLPTPHQQNSTHVRVWRMVTIST